MVTFLPPNQQAKTVFQPEQRVKLSGMPLASGKPASKDSVLFGAKRTVASLLLTTAGALAILPLASACSSDGETYNEVPVNITMSDPAHAAKVKPVIYADGVVANEVTQQPLGNFNENGEAFRPIGDGKTAKVAFTNDEGKIFGVMPYNGNEYLTQIGQLNLETGEVTDTSGKALCKFDVDGDVINPKQQGAIAALACFDVAQGDAIKAHAGDYNDHYNPSAGSPFNNFFFWMWLMDRNRVTYMPPSYTGYRTNYYNSLDSNWRNSAPGTVVRSTGGKGEIHSGGFGDTHNRSVVS